MYEVLGQVIAWLVLVSVLWGAYRLYVLSRSSKLFPLSRRGKIVVSALLWWPFLVFCFICGPDIVYEFDREGVFFLYLLALVVPPLVAFATYLNYKWLKKPQ